MHKITKYYVAVHSLRDPVLYTCIYMYVKSIQTLASTRNYIQKGDSALKMAVRRGETGVVKELVEARADMNLQNKVCQNEQLLPLTAILYICDIVEPPRADTLRSGHTP